MRIFLSKEDQKKTSRKEVVIKDLPGDYEDDEEEVEKCDVNNKRDLIIQVL